MCMFGPGCGAAVLFANTSYVVCFIPVEKANSNSSVRPTFIYLLFLVFDKVRSSQRDM